MSQKQTYWLVVSNSHGSCELKFTCGELKSNESAIAEIILCDNLDKFRELLFESVFDELHEKIPIGKNSDKNMEKIHALVFVHYSLPEVKNETVKQLLRIAEEFDD